ncbi:hypothetical protein [Streptomyces galbus]|jgi:hypothetical protein|nr:hypothetical protein [Streptomyces galbus]
MQPLFHHARMPGHRPEGFARLAEGRSPAAPFPVSCAARALPAPIAGTR